MRQRLELEALGKRILDEIRTELYLAMRFMGPALDALGYQMDLTTHTVGTDAEMIRFNPLYLMQVFLEHPRRLSRCYMHMLLHCLFRHLFSRGRYEDRELFDLCADIAAEAILDTIDAPVVYEIPSDFRQSWYQKLHGEIQVLTAEKLYRWFMDRPRDYETEYLLAAEFHRDDHSFWDRLDDRPRPQDQKQSGPDENPPEENDWNKRAKQTQSLLSGSGRKASGEYGSLAWVLAIEAAAKTDYRDFLRRFMVLREEMRIDPDGFDYGYYTYGLELYGNMPLIEENEFRELIAIDQLVIAIDTSGSTRGHLVQQFLKETAAILASQETFFHHVQIHLIECDNKVQKDLLLTKAEDLSACADHFELSGGMGTDFRPVFAYIRDRQRKGQLQNLRGLLYFTDGYGTYPAEATAYDTAFVFCTDGDYDDREVPDWAIRLYAGFGEIRQFPLPDQDIFTKSEEQQ